MSASQDRTQKVAFVYSNLYHIYQKGKRAASGAVIKAEDLQSNEKVAIQTSIRPYKPIELMMKRMDQQQAAQPAQSHPVESLKRNLKSLNEVHSRLKFMLGELEDLMQNDEKKKKS